MEAKEIYKKALEKISKCGIKPTGETGLQRIKRLKSIADKALFIANAYQSLPTKPVSVTDEDLKRHFDYAPHERKDLLIEGAKWMRKQLTEGEGEENLTV